MQHGHSVGGGSGEEEGDGWEFWGKVYEDPGLRQQIAQRTQRGPTVSELLQDDNLCEAELLFINVPRIGKSQQSVVRQLLNTQLGRQVPVQDIAIMNRQWKIRFYRSEDADEVQKKLDGLRYKNGFLMVRASAHFERPLHGGNGHNTSGDKGHMTANKQSPAKMKTKESALSFFSSSASPKTIDPSFSPVEMREFEIFKNEVISILTNHQEGMLVNQLVGELCKRTYGCFITTSLDLWSLALLRMCQPEVRLIGLYVSLRTHNLHGLHLLKVIREGASTMAMDEWEPTATSNICTESHLKTYVTALLTKFGPQHCKVDIPIRLLSRTLPGHWPLGSVALCQMIGSLGPNFLLFDDMLYLSTNVRHRRALLDRLVPPKTPQALDREGSNESQF